MRLLKWSRRYLYPGDYAFLVTSPKNTAHYFRSFRLFSTQYSSWNFTNQHVMDKDAIVAKSNMSVNTDAERSTKPADVKSSSSPSPQRSPSSSSTSRATHRQSFTESFRNPPPSPRHRHPSLTQAAIQDLVNHPPSTSRHQNPKFVGREWEDVTIGELVSRDYVRWIDIECSVEEATMVSTDYYLRCCLTLSTHAEITDAATEPN